MPACFYGKACNWETESKDMKELERFGREVTAALKREVAEALRQEATEALKVPGDPHAEYYKPLGMDMQPAVFLKATPKTDEEKCDGCGVCPKLCPMGSIDKEEPSKITGICIKCHACVNGCPKGAKYFDDPAFISHREMLEHNYTAPKEARWFII